MSQPALPATLHADGQPLRKVPYKRIAAEEAWAPAELLEIYRRMLETKALDDPGFNTMFGFYMSSPSLRTQQIRDYLVDLGDQRIGHMDERGIDMQIVSMTSPGVQVLPKDEATRFAAYANDVLAEGCRKHPTRFAGLADVAPQDARSAAKELERGVNKLGLKGAIINSHTFGEYLDDEKFFPLLEAAEALDTPIYLHPQVPWKTMSAPFLDVGLDGAIYGFGVETGLHLLRLVTTGVFDRFPKLTVVVGHLGEALPFWMCRLDYMNRAGVVSKRYERMRPLQLGRVSEYLRRNVYITSSGFAWEPAIKFCQDVLGVDRVLYAMDYPYQHDRSEVVASDDLDIPDDVKKAFFQTNAERVFKL